MAPTSFFADLVTRDESPEQILASQSHFKTYYIIGIVLAVLLVVGASVWLVIRRYRKLASSRREREANHRALNVRGLMRDNDDEKRCVSSRVVIAHLLNIPPSFLIATLSSLKATTSSSPT